MDFDHSEFWLRGETRVMTIENEERIIGGMFGLETPKETRHASPTFITQSKCFLVNGRSGIALVIRQLSIARAWIPSYLCESIIDALNGSAVEINFYEVNYDLEIASSTWVDDVESGDLVVLIDYFGFHCFDGALASRIKEQGAWILEDACQALLSDVATYSDFVLYSPRKFVGVPDGGILTVKCKVNLDGVSLASAPELWWLKSLRASLLRREYDHDGASRAWFDLFQESESSSPIGLYSISDLSKSLLTCCIDYSLVAERRVENFRLLSEELREFALFKDVPVGVVPVGFPIRVKSRDRIRAALFGHGIYPPVHWQIGRVVPDRFSDSHRLAADIMTLPCDQRYTGSEMRRMLECLKAANPEPVVA